VDLDRQIDDWSCGLFLLMALQCFALRIDYKKWCKDSLKEMMREKSLEVLKAISYVYPSQDNKFLTNFNGSIKSGGADCKNVTALITICADGTKLQCTIIFKGQNFMSKWDQDNVSKAL